jgi:hypothetical protein
MSEECPLDKQTTTKKNTVMKNGVDNHSANMFTKRCRSPSKVKAKSLESKVRDGENSSGKERAGDRCASSTVGLGTFRGSRCRARAARGLRSSGGGARAAASISRRRGVVLDGRDSVVSGESQGSTSTGHVDLAVSAQDLGVHGEEHAGVHDVAHVLALSPLWHSGNVVLATPVHDVAGGVVLGGHHVCVRPHRGEGAVVADHHGHHARDRVVRVVGQWRVDRSPHSLLAVTGCATVEEDGVRAVDGLIEAEWRIVCARCKGVVVSLVAREQLGRLGDRVVLGHPDVVNGVTWLGRDDRRNEAKDTLHRGNDDGVVVARALRACVRRRSVGRRSRAELSNAFYAKEIKSVAI